MNIFQTERAMTITTGEMHMSKALACIIQMANTIFLRARTIIDIMQQMGFRQQCQGTENGRAINGR